MSTENNGDGIMLLVKTLLEDRKRQDETDARRERERRNDAALKNTLQKQVGQSNSRVVGY